MIPPRSLTVALLVAALAMPAMARRRAVGPPAVPSHVMQAAAEDDLRYTNHGTGVAAVRTCIERTNQCITDVINPGATQTHQDLVKFFGLPTANLEMYANKDTEIRGRFDAIPTILATTARQNIPLMAAGQTLTVYAMNNGSAELHRLGNNGVRVEERTIPLVTGTNTITLTGTPGSLGDQYDLIPSVNTVATSIVDGVQHRAKTLEEGVGRQFLVRANDQTFAYVKNVDPTSILSLFSIRYTPDASGTFANNFDALNWGTKYVNNITNGVAGSVDIHGNRINNVEQPFLGWSKTPFQIEGATANTRFVIDKRYNLSLNQIPEDGILSLYAAQTDAHFTLNAYNNEGTKTGTTSGTLLPNQSTDLDIRSLGGTRLDIVVADRTDNVAGHPNLLLSANVNGIVKTGYRVEKPVPIVRVTGEQYVTKWGDMLKEQGFYLDNTEVRCMVNGNCGTRSYAPDMAAILARSAENTSGYTAAQFEQQLRNWTDGNPSNGEFYPGFDPHATSIANRKTGFYFMPSGQTTLIYTLSPQDINSWYSDVVRPFLVEYTQTTPAKYGGSTTTGPDLNYNPTWMSQDPN